MKYSKLIFILFIFLGYVHVDIAVSLDAQQAITGLTREEESSASQTSCKNFCNTHPQINNCSSMCAVCGPYCRGSCLGKISCIEDCMQKCDSGKMN